MITLRTLCLLTIMPVLGAQKTPAKTGTEKTACPNIVFILIDDLGYMDVGANNPDCFYQTPNIDALAASGMRFTNGYAANPVCSPTRYSIQTGRYPSRVDATNYFTGKRAGKFRPAVLHNRMPRSETTIAEALRAKGYTTAFAGKWHLGPDDAHGPEAQGYDENFGGFHRGHPKSYFSPYKNPKLSDGPPGEHLPTRLTDESIAFIDRVTAGDKTDHKPFFLFLAYYSVHTPLQAPADLIEKYRARAAKFKGAQFATEEQVFATKKIRRVRIRQKHAVYAAMVESMDTQIGRLLDHLDKKNLSRNTVVILTSDNGGLSTSEGMPTSNLPLRGGKGWLYEGGIREPFVIRWPGVTKPGSRCDEPVISTDFYPTLLAASGQELRPKQHLDGLSLVPLLRGEQSLGRDAMFWHYPHYSNQGGIPGAAIRMGDWKLIERFEDGSIRLYNLADDLGEHKDLAAVTPKRVTALRSRLHDWYREVDAKFLRAKKGGPAPWRPEAR